MQVTSTWGWTHEEERKAKTERDGKIERWLERADRCHSAGRRRLWCGVKYLSAWERRSTVNQGVGGGPDGDLRCAPQSTRTTGVTAQPDFTMAGHCEGRHTLANTIWRSETTPSSDLHPDLSGSTRGASLYRVDTRRSVHLPQKGLALGHTTNLAKLGTRRQWR